MRFLIVVLGLLAAAAPALALEPKDLIGRWSTEWGSAAGAATDASADVYITPDADASGSLDGAWNVPGMNGLMHGTVEQGEDGAVVWTGRWIPAYSASEAGGGTFRFVFINRDAFTGTWSTDNGGVRDAPWNGRRR